MDAYNESLLLEETSTLVTTWLDSAQKATTKAEKKQNEQLRNLIEDPNGTAFAMAFIDRVARPSNSRVAAKNFRALTKTLPKLTFLSSFDIFLMKLGGMTARIAPFFVVPAAIARMRQIVGKLVIDADASQLAKHSASQKKHNFRQNTNLLGEMVLGEGQSQRKLEKNLALIATSEITYVSIKLSSLLPGLSYWDYDRSLRLITQKLENVFDHAQQSTPETFINLDMEEYHDLQFTIDAFKAVLSLEKFKNVEAGIVMQAYLPDSFAALQDLTAWAQQRCGNGGASIKVRLVKGANLAMEKVQAAIEGWQQAPYATKAETDANYLRCLDWLLTEDRTDAVRLGLASHNLFTIAWALQLAQFRGVSDRVECEMLQGMAPAQARAVNAQTPNDLLLYTPIVAKKDFDVAIAYLFRRLEENSSAGNFLRSLLSLTPTSVSFGQESQRFASALQQRWRIAAAPQRQQQRPALQAHAATQPQDRFVNEPNSDPALAATRQWAQNVLTQKPAQKPALITSPTQIESELATGRKAAIRWQQKPLSQRRDLLHKAADKLAQNRGALIAILISEGKKTFSQADAEVSEAIDFARYYGDHVESIANRDHVTFQPFGAVAIAGPWNFPVAIPLGGALAALAAGNAALIKPAPQTTRCALLATQCCWQAGIDTQLLRFVPTQDDEAGKTLITSADAVVLTGSAETAKLFKSWKPSMRLFAETSGKNAMIITENADVDQAVADIVASAFGHSGQKCSAASLVIGVGKVATSERFLRQLKDATQSLRIGFASDLSCDVTPLMTKPEAPLQRALTQLDAGERWLVEPKQLDARHDLWSPGIRLGVKPDAWFADTECFGPVVGIITAESLEEAVAIQNGSSFGLTGGIHSLDATEIAYWTDKVEVGNGYINRPITGAIVNRQPFGGWKKSSFGPGAKAGGPNYVQQFGTWQSTSGLTSDQFIATAKQSDTYAWSKEFSLEHDPTALFCEANIFRYKAHKHVGLWTEQQSDLAERARDAAQLCGSSLLENTPGESFADFVKRCEAHNIEVIRLMQPADANQHKIAADHAMYLADQQVTADGYIELQHYVREQSLSITQHRFGNIVAPYTTS